MVNKDILYNLGLTEKEALIYELLLPLGQATVSTLSRKTKLPRSTIAYNCKSLLEKGFIHCIKKNDTQFFSIVDANVILADLQRKKQELSKKELLANTLQEIILAKRHSQASVPTIREFAGTEGIMAMLDDVLAYEGNIYGCFDMESEADDLLIEYVKNVYIPKRRQNNNSAFSLFTDNIKNVQYQKYDSSLKRVSLLIPKDYLPFQSCLYLYGDAIALHSSVKGNQSALLIKNASYAKTLKSLFAIAWDKAISLKVNADYKNLTSNQIGL